MMRPLALAIGLTLVWGFASAAVAEPVGEAAQVATKAAEDLGSAIEALDAADEAKDRVSALTETIRAYEAGLTALREALRQAELREDTLTLQFETKRESLAQLLGALGAMDPDQGPLLMLHPGGALGTARSGMMLAEVAPALATEAAKLRQDLQELADLRALQASAGGRLMQGLGAVQEARTKLSQAISDRTELPKRLTEDPEALQMLLDSAETMSDFAEGLAPVASSIQGFADRRGTLAWPALGKIILRPGETDAQGVTRPGVTLATRPLALVTAPFAATIRFRGPLLDYGNVTILEPGGDYLIILAGLSTLYGEVGDVVGAGQALGLMGGAEGEELADILSDHANEGGAGATETLYLEIRQKAEPLNPLDWFVPNEE
jgi:septal ring factor EnvC (AmiA/AmiB activator)